MTTANATPSAETSAADVAALLAHLDRLLGAAPGSYYMHPLKRQTVETIYRYLTNYRYLLQNQEAHP